MFNFFKNWFQSNSYGMGSLPTPYDSRNIQITQVQMPVAIPEFHLTDISTLGVSNQGSKPSCVGYSIAKIAEYYIWKRTGKIVKFDGDKLYAQCKLEDGIPFTAGTYSVVGVKVIIRDGIDQHDVESNDKVATGYAFVPIDFEQICQAIYQNGMLTIGTLIDSNWFKGIIGKVLKNIGGHQTSLHGYDMEDKKLYGINSWGIKWIGQIAGLIDPKVRPGFYVAKFNDIEDSILNIIAITAIPKEVIEEAKNTEYKFTTTMKVGSSGLEVKRLQERLGVFPTTGYYGTLTKNKVAQFQYSKGLVSDGIAGPATIRELNGGPSKLSKLDLWAEAIKEHEGWKPGTRSYRNNNPGNIKFVGQGNASGKDAQGFCIFPTYEAGYNELKEMLKRCATPPETGTYKSTMTLLEFFQKYAPSADNNNPAVYARAVARKIGCEVDTQIKNLID